MAHLKEVSGPCNCLVCAVTPLPLPHRRCLTIWEPGEYEKCPPRARCLTRVCVRAFARSTKEGNALGNMFQPKKEGTADPLNDIMASIQVCQRACPFIMAPE
jgi:hypothetical protein